MLLHMLYLIYIFAFVYIKADEFFIDNGVMPTKKLKVHWIKNTGTLTEDNEWGGEDFDEITSLIFYDCGSKRQRFTLTQNQVIARNQQINLEKEFLFQFQSGCKFTIKLKEKDGVNDDHT